MTQIIAKQLLSGTSQLQATKKVTLVLLPGLDGTDVFFIPLLRHLPVWVEPIVITYPQTGNNSYDALLSIVTQQISSLESFVILGWSFGGPLALMVAEKFPAQVGGVILCGSFVSSPRRWLTPWRFVLIPPVVALARAVRRARLLIPGYASPELRKAKAVTWRGVKASALASRARAALSMNARTILLNCRADLMYIASSRDEIISSKHLHEIRSIAPHTRLAEIEGAHLAMFTNPAQSADCILRFMRSLANSGQLWRKQ